jgi:hypothetical protein
MKTIKQTGRPTRRSKLSVRPKTRVGIASILLPIAFSAPFEGAFEAERVVQHAPCPVLVAREREHEFFRG